MKTYKYIKHYTHIDNLCLHINIYKTLHIDKFDNSILLNKTLSSRATKMSIDNSSFPANNVAHLHDICYLQAMLPTRPKDVKEQWNYQCMAKVRQAPSYFRISETCRCFVKQCL